MIPWLATVAALLLGAPDGRADELEEAYGLLERKQLDQAQGKVDAFLKSHQGDPRGRFVQGLLQVERRELDKAVETFKGLTKDYPDLPEPYNNLGALYAEKGEFEKARDVFLKAIRTHPSYATAHENLGDLYARMATVAYDKVLRINQDHNMAKAKLAMMKDLLSLPTPTGEGDKSAASQSAAASRAAAPSTAPAVAPPTASPDAARKAQEKDEVAQAVQEWAAAWTSRNPDRYLAVYASDFSPPRGASLASWTQERRQRLQSARAIEVRVEGMKINLLSNGRAQASFVQHYKSDNYQDKVGKILFLKQDGGRWKIVQELADG
ncbi:MAG: tetratricopeptide repeat protein [Magnetococcales bacterium]|nr:tetratricopeptide repeat protein [Magnetococcales bacterium]